MTNIVESNRIKNNQLEFSNEIDYNILEDYTVVDIIQSISKETNMEIKNAKV